MITLAIEDVLDVIKTRGKFQWRLNIIFCYFGGFFTGMCCQMFYLAMQTPDHWCYVPGREYTNLSREEWKNMTIPKDGSQFSKCSMYNVYGEDDSSNISIVPCQHGWEYDDTWYSLTAPSQMNWVCDQQQTVSNIMFYTQIIGSMLGLCFGYIGDMFGRRPLVLLTLLAVVIGRVTLVLTPSVIVLFTLAQALPAAAVGPFFESITSVGVELADIRHRSLVNRNVCIAATAGGACTALVAWTLRNWTYFLLLPVIFYLPLIFFFRWFPESPRWLACRGRDQEALVVLRRIAATNGSTVPPFAAEVLHKLAKSKDDKRGFSSILNSWNLFKNTLILIVSRAVIGMTLYAMVLSVGILNVHPFVTISIEGVAQVLAIVLMHCYISRMGRRWASVAGVLLTGFMSAAITLLIYVGAPSIALMAAVAVLQFVAAAGQTVQNLQSLEVHPTCLRQITTAMELSAFGLGMSLVPYIVLLGGSIDKRLPFAILAALNVPVAFFMSFLPETALQRLPETLEDAAVFGKEQRYWSWKPKPAPTFLPEQ